MLPHMCALDLNLTLMPSQPASFSAHLYSIACLLDAWFTLGFLLLQNPGQLLAPCFRWIPLVTVWLSSADWLDYLLGWETCSFSAQTSQQVWHWALFLWGFFPFFMALGSVFVGVFPFLTTSSTCNINSILPCLQRVLRLGGWLRKGTYVPSIPLKSILACAEEGTIFPPHQELSMKPLVWWMDGQLHGPESLWSESSTFMMYAFLKSLS